MQQRPKPFVLSIFFVLTIMTALGWLGVQYVGWPLTLISPSDSFALGRSGIIAPSDDSLPETLTPRENRSLQGSMIFFMGVMMSPQSRITMFNQTVVGSYDNGPARVFIVVQAPKDGWYIINCVTTGFGAKASLTTVAQPPVNVTSWDYRNRPQGMYLYPALVELKAGQHFFFWRLEDVNGSVEFLETHILKAKLEG